MTWLHRILLRERRGRVTLLVAVSLLSLLAMSSTVEARITRIQIPAVESPALGGASFGSVGQFEKLTGTAYGEVDPHHPLNAIIQDIDLAPRNAGGMVEYSTDIYILKPIDMTKGNRMLFYHVVNRGNGGIPFNVGVPAGNNPASAGDGFIQSMGYTLIKSGWQPDVLPGNSRMTMSVPIARNPDGSSITGTVRAEFIVAAATTTLNLSSGTFTGLTHASYPTVSTDNKTLLSDGFLPTMTVRSHEKDPRVSMSNNAWAFGSCPDGVHVTASTTQICMLGAGFQPGKIYELLYRGKDPIVIGLGYAGMRDLISFFKHARHDDAGTANPLWVADGRGRGSDREDDGDNNRGDEQEHQGVLATFSGASQSGRNMRTFIHLGFNEDERGRIVFDGAFPLIGGGRAAFNIRFGQPGRAWGYVADHVYPAYQFPFTYGESHDPITGETDGILKRCLKTNTCPKIFHFATSLEIWEGRQSLGLTDPAGRRDVDDPDVVRAYVQTSTQHGPAAFPPGFTASLGPCQQQLNPNSYLETQRALWVALTDWLKRGVQPPPSHVPRLRDGTLVPPTRVDFPHIPANTYGGISRPAVKFLALANPLSVLDYGPLFNGLDETGILTVEPPGVGNRQYPIFVPQVDADGNDIGGVRSTAVLAPTATYTGWNLYSGVFQDDFCTLSGSYIPFARTRAERLATGDPRPSLEERYGTHAGYVDAVRKATATLVKQRLLLPADADRLIGAADASDVLK
jgi:Alpha/beta hydrolase domain